MENQNLVSYTSVDDAAATKAVMEYILSVEHIRIALLYGLNWYRYARQRRAGYLQTLEVAHILLNKNWIIQLPKLNSDMALSFTYQLMFQKEHPITVSAISSVLAVATTRGCRLAGLSILTDIIVTGLDNVNTSQATSPSTTTINQPKYQIGCTACELLIEKLNTPEVEPRQVLLNTEPIVQESTQRQRTQHQDITDREAYPGVK